MHKALTSVFDHGFLYGDGVYETLRVYKGVVFKFDEHIERLFRSASMIRINISRPPREIKDAVYKTLKANNHKEAYVRINVTRGVGDIGLDPELCPKPTFVVISKPFKALPKSCYEKGVKVAIVKVRRNFKGALDPMIKSLNFLNNIIAYIEAKAQGAYEAIMLNYKGYIAEGTTSNIFFLKNNTLCTPDLGVGVLDGITRNIILDIADELGIKSKEGKFTPEDIYNADEVFVSNTTKEIVPVTMIDDVKIGSRTGKITKMLSKAYKKKVAEHIRQGKVRSGK
ncbi:MAG: branched-chain-amino-acid transaminase [Nitrospirae bacterium]|nr:branched-chain-amino-acid transaminase [Nitrospirota bacterium]